jgi:hypothetical protein
MLGATTVRAMASNLVADDRGQTVAKTKVFISHSRKNIAFANRLDAALKARGFGPLIDRTEIYAFGDSIASEVCTKRDRLRGVAQQAVCAAEALLEQTWRVDEAADVGSFARRLSTT